MLRRILLTALVAGLLSGLVSTVLQMVTTTPIILHAESFEKSGDHEHKDGHAGLAGAEIVPAHATGHEHPPHASAAWAPMEGLERLYYTSLANLIAGVAFGLMLTACLSLHGKETDGRRGVLWGLAGFAVFTLAPSLGLPPEVPGSAAADLTSRQEWWFFAVAAAALGLWLMVFGKRPVFVVLGIGIIAAPHLFGAPQPDAPGSAVPAEIAAHFVAASLVTSAIFWTTLGWLSGTFYKRFA